MAVNFGTEPSQDVWQSHGGKPGVLLSKERPGKRRSLKVALLTIALVLFAPLARTARAIVGDPVGPQ